MTGAAGARRRLPARSGRPCRLGRTRRSFARRYLPPRCLSTSGPCAEEPPQEIKQRHAGTLSLRRKIERAACPRGTVGMGGRAGRPTTCEALVSWSPRACRVGSRGEVMRSTRRPGETPGTCWLVADAAALPVAFMAGGGGLVNRASCVPSSAGACRCVGAGRLMPPSCDRRPAARSEGAARESAATGLRPERPAPRAARRRRRGLRVPAPGRAAPPPAR